MVHGAKGTGSKRLRIGMVGGGPGAFIGAVHRIALAMDGEFELVAGAFSSDPSKSRETGNELGLDSSRIYGSYDEMAEKSRPATSMIASMPSRSSRQTTSTTVQPRRSSREAFTSSATNR